jgi:hypothetical protein
MASDTESVVILALFRNAWRETKVSRAVAFEITFLGVVMNNAVDSMKRKQSTAWICSWIGVHSRRYWGLQGCCYHVLRLSIRAERLGIDLVIG